MHMLNHKCILARQPVKIVAVVHLVDIGLDSCHLRRILILQVDDVEDVEPQVMVFADVSIEATLAKFVKDETILVADETDVLRVHLNELFLLTHLREGIDNDTEEDVE